MTKLIAALIAITLFATPYVHAAHSAGAQLIKSTPEEDSVNDPPPSAFTFEFSEAVQLHQLFIKKDDDKQKPIDRLPSQYATTLTIPAPSLTPGHYVLEWSVFTRDSTVRSGRIRFTVSAG
jgi:methionine-rich copper-binding protein CopC